MDMHHRIHHGREMLAKFGACLIGFGIVTMSLIFLSAPVKAGLCDPGWRIVSTTYWGFTYGQDGQGRQLWWTGNIIVRENYDRNCYVIDAELDFYGDSMTIAGLNVYGSFTVQYPSPFTDYVKVLDNAKGNVIYSNPAPGIYAAYSVTITHGATGDEYKLVSTVSGVSTIAPQQIYFHIGASYKGLTVYAQIYAGPGLKNEPKAISIPE